MLEQLTISLGYLKAPILLDAWMSAFIHPHKQVTQNSAKRVAKVISLVSISSDIDFLVHGHRDASFIVSTNEISGFGKNLIDGKQFSLKDLSDLSASLEKSLLEAREVCTEMTQMVNSY